MNVCLLFFFFFQAEDGIRDVAVTGVQTCALPIFPFPGRDILFGFMLGTMMIPGILFLIPTYIIMYRLGWVPGFRALIIPGAVSVFNIFLLRQFFRHIPSALVEAARL